MFLNVNLKEISCLLENYLLEQGMRPFWASSLNLMVNIFILGTIAYFFDRVLRKIIVESFKAFSLKTKTTFDDFLVESNFPRYIAHIIPLLLLKNIFPVVFDGFPMILNVFMTITTIYGIILIVKIIRSVLRSSKKYLRTLESYSDKPLDSYMQVMMIFLWGIAIFFVVYEITGKDILSFATLGAASAVILLIFKDTILGFVASIQVSVNDIVRIGDWITFSKYGADGYVTDINLATVRVQNWDNTYTTIPTYSLISDSFQNWRGMQESAGRRIKRAIFIKQSSIQFLTPEMIEKYKKIELVRPYIEHRQKEITKHNEKINADKSVLINGRNQTNFGVFRKFVDASINENSAINKELFLMVRQLHPTSKGIPLEIFCFSNDKRWQNYEAIMADIFDHVIASVPYFDLELFEDPTGNDIKALVNLNQPKISTTTSPPNSAS
ncbi:MAG: mechanosensitive ion channel protein MscS [Bacteroidetes bacterium HGW-Bacteroidetes-2]|jgi:miniconductance mechanosensitive channel|nr:MAG: mechanosensitive ion channel protein MscS [Bacteroidetes bacterium HGW-Bacteroidetes-2]